MFVKKYLCFLFIILFVKYSLQDAQNFKQFVDLEDYTDLAAGNVVIDESSNNNVTYICGENIKNDCECKVDSIECTLWFKGANVKPLKKNFEIRKAKFSIGNIPVLRRNEILPDNEDTVSWLSFKSVGLKFIEAGAFDKFITLSDLWLPENELTFINENVLTPKLGSTLSILILSQNNFTTINPMVFKNMKKLTHLWFDSNRNPIILTDIFPEMNLEMIDFSFGRLKVLEEDVFKNLPKLKFLMLDGNNLTTIPATIKYLPNLYQIQMAHNLITKIDKNAFLNNPKLVYIFLNNNPLLKLVDDCAFCGLTDLEWIWLNSCHQLSYIHENAFGSISTGKAPSFDSFLINECNITVLPENLIDWKNMKRLDIGGNPFVCNCSMAWLFADLLSDSSIYDKKIKRRYRGHKYILGCFPPMGTAYKHFLKPINISEILEPCKTINSSSNLFWFFVAVIFGVFSVFGIYVYHQQLNSMFTFYSVRFRNRNTAQ